MRHLAVAIALFAIACDRGHEGPNQLENLTLSYGPGSAPSADDDGLWREDLAGGLEVDGADQDWTLTSTDEAGEAVSLEIHSPGGLDLSTLAGESSTVELVFSVAYIDGDTWDDDEDQRLEPAAAVVVSDASGPRYVADAGLEVGLGDALFGEGFVGYGAAMETVESDPYEYHYQAIVVQTDDGPVELEPGDVATITVGGQLWRFAAIASFEIEAMENPRNAMAMCGGPADVLAYEMLRVEEPAETTRRTRPEELGQAWAPGSC